MSVRFTLVDRQLKMFRHGLQSLQKIGSELLLEALPARVRPPGAGCWARPGTCWEGGAICTQLYCSEPSRRGSQQPPACPPPPASHPRPAHPPPPRPPPSAPAPPAQVVLRTINSSLSAYLSVTYAAQFFEAYDVLDCNVVQAGLLMKAGAGRALLGAHRSALVSAPSSAPAPVRCLLGTTLLRCKPRAAAR